MNKLSKWRCASHLLSWGRGGYVWYKFKWQRQKPTQGDPYEIWVQTDIEEDPVACRERSEKLWSFGYMCHVIYVVFFWDLLSLPSLRILFSKYLSYGFDSKSQAAVKVFPSARFQNGDGISWMEWIGAYNSDLGVALILGVLLSSITILVMKFTLTNPDMSQKSWKSHEELPSYKDPVPN